MQIPRSLCAGVAGLVLMGGCGGGPDTASPASPDLPPAPAFSPAQPQETALKTLHDFEAYRQPPALAEVERALRAQATAVPRTDRHLEAGFPGGVRYLRLTPAPPDGRPRLDTGPMAALTVPAAADAACLAPDALSRRLEASGWLPAPRFAAERHGGGGPQAPWVFSRHDRHLQLQVFVADDGCPRGYALMWNMDLSLLAQLMPEGLPRR